MQRLGGKIPGYAAGVLKEFESGTGVEGVRAVKNSEDASENHGGNDFDDESMFEQQSELPDELPDKVIQKLEKQEEQLVRINLELKVKNEKILELLSELEEIKIQVFARDKSIELQQNQIEDLLEELRESKGLENDVKILVQKKIALQDENDRLREELNQMLLSGSDNKDESNDLLIINKALKNTIADLQKQIENEVKIRKIELSKAKQEVMEVKKTFEETNKAALSRDREID